MALVVGFLVFSGNIGALQSFGRKPLSWRKLGALSVAAFIPALGTLGCICMATVKEALANPAVMALSMATLGWVCYFAFKKLEEVAMVADSGAKEK